MVKRKMKLTSLTLLLLFQVYLVASVPACKNLLNIFCQFSGYCMNFNQVDLTLNGQTFSLNNYDVIGFGSVNIAANGGVGGRVATRNDFTAGAGVTIGSGIVSGGTSPTDVPVPFSLIVGRNALWTSGALFPDGSLGPVENIFVGGTFTAPPNLSARRTGGPCNLCLDAPFMAAQSFYDSISKKMATYLPNTQASISGTTLSITCNNPRDAIYFVALDESINNVAAFGAISNCNPSALWIFNIGGSSDIILRPNFDFGAIIINVLHGSGPTRNVFLAGTSTALVLAPLATVTQQSGIWTGEIIAIDINLNVLLHRGCSVIKAVTSGAFTTGNPTVFPPPVTGFTTGFGFTTGRITSGFSFTTGNPTVFPPPVTGFAFTTGRFTSFSFTTGNPTVNPPPITGFTTGLLTTAEVKKCDKKDYYDCKKGDDHCNKDYDRCRKNDDDCNKKWKDDCKKEQKTTGIITSGFTTGGITVQPPPPPPTAGVTTGIIIGKTCPFWQTPCAGFAFTADGFTLSFTDFDVVSFGGLQGRTNGAIQGRVISRNDIIFGENFVVGSNVASGLPYSLVGGRSVTWPSGALYPTTAGMWVGGNFVGGPDLIARITGGPCPGCLDPNFDAALGCYVSIQQSLLSLTPNVDWDLRYSGLELACQSYYQDLYIVQINAEDFSRVLWYMMLNCNPNAKWVINILGSDDVVFYGGSFPANPRNVVYNIVGAGRTVIIHDALVLGSILAPLNIVNEASGIVVGKIIAGDIVYLTQVNTIACYTKDGAAIEGESDPWDYKSTAGGMIGSKLLLSTCIFALTYLQRRIRD